MTRAYGLDFLFPMADEVVGASLRRAGEFARPELDVIDKLMAKGGAFLDVGANIGTMAVPIAARHPAARVVAIEANRHLAMILSTNALANRLTNLDVHHAAAGATAGLARFPAPSLESAINFGALSFRGNPGSAPTETVRMCTLDEIAPPQTRVIKIDVEGHETDVLAGAPNLLASRNQSWVIEHKGDANSIAITQKFLDAGYGVFWLFAPFVTPNATKRTDVQTSVSGDTNILAIPGGEPPVPMTRIHSANDTRPGSIDGYPYLLDYGFRSA
ncbi:FkbM family methyltransferase [Sphingomonas sp. PR090111-T3T-6A]|uniref:FkbM family methyltransferase n=1 Tax=Sphingomonas sp. PR090111-T3T-6A TaxID=685778 RepID=UPI00138ADCF0|nr:FkbM family methyltransferase [Sphingomonas sp. PR090111-T3T-6A]